MYGIFYWWYAFLFYFLRVLTLQKYFCRYCPVFLLLLLKAMSVSLSNWHPISIFFLFPYDNYLHAWQSFRIGIYIHCFLNVNVQGFWLLCTSWCLCMCMIRFHMKDLCVISYGLILMTDVGGGYHLVVLVIHLDRI